MTKPTIVFIHGLFQNPESWREWMVHFQARGYTCVAPAYPFHEGAPAELRAHPDRALRKLRLGQVVESIAKYIDSLPGAATGEKPVLIGHSMGGLVTQLLVARGIARAAVVIDTAPPAGVMSFRKSFLRANLATVNPLRGNSICLPSVDWFQYAFCNTMSRADTQRAYDEFVVPESRNIPRSSTGVEGRVDFTKPHAPLLFIAGEQDHIIPPSLNWKNYRRYARFDRVGSETGGVTTSVTDFKQFPGRTHYICGQQGWEEVAEFVREWVEKH